MEACRKCAASWCAAGERKSERARYNCSEQRARASNDPVLEAVRRSSRTRTEERVREELRRMALDELRSAKQLTQTEMAALLDVPQSSISRIERRAGMYLSTLRNYINAMGGFLQIQAIFPDGGAVVIDRFGDYENELYTLWFKSDGKGSYRLIARPLHHKGEILFTRRLSAPGFIKSLKALHLFTAADLVAAGFDAGHGQD